MIATTIKKMARLPIGTVTDCANIPSDVAADDCRKF